MDEIEWWEFDTPAELAEQVSGDIGFVIESAIEAHGGARVALPGGRMIEPIAKALVKSKGIAWPKVTILPTDDRLVPASDPLSNFGKLQKLFGSKGARLHALTDDASLGDYQAAGRAAEARLNELDGPLDLVCLGMGEDGHTASIFPRTGHGTCTIRTQATPRCRCPSAPDARKRSGGSGDAHRSRADRGPHRHGRAKRGEEARGTRTRDQGWSTIPGSNRARDRRHRRADRYLLER
jgi:6-phosphogluconolactonase/glucosamine-6-phosphate isomerase/deaminase